MITSQQIYWLAGLLEGEGCFSHQAGTPRVTINMTDKDVIENIKQRFKVGYLFYRGNPEKEKHPNYKPQYSWYALGKEAIGIMLSVYTLLGKRRQEKIREILDIWRQQKQLRNIRGKSKRVDIFSFNETP